MPLTDDEGIHKLKPALQRASWEYERELINPKPTIQRGSWNMLLLFVCYVVCFDFLFIGPAYYSKGASSHALAARRNARLNRANKFALVM